MFGLNVIRKPSTDAVNLAVQEIFYTIQGEGPLAGEPAVFIRLAGCNLACSFCDTEFESGMLRDPMTPREIAIEAQVAAGDCMLASRSMAVVVLTGGEPLRQPLGQLCRALIQAGTKLIQIETAGTLWCPDLEPLIHDGFVMIVCSPKTPKVHPAVAQHCENWKYIIRAGGTSQGDGLPNRATQAHNEGELQELFRPWSSSQVADRKHVIWVSPCDEHNAEKSAANMREASRVAMRYGYRLTLQMHKLLGLP